MRSRAEFLSLYAQSHRNPRNQFIHLICVPAIFMSTVGFAWLVPLGSWLARLQGVPVQAVAWSNLATVAAVPVLIFYARLGLSSFLTAIVWLSISFLACAAIQSAGASLLGVSAVVWVSAWAAQFYGHKLEGAKPSFADDLVFLLIGPLYVQDKLLRLGSAR